MKAKAVYISAEKFSRGLETCLKIISLPSKAQPYYVCEYTPAHLRSNSIVHIYIV